MSSSTRSSVTAVPTISNSCFPSGDDNHDSIDIEKGAAAKSNQLTYCKHNTDEAPATTTPSTRLNKVLSHFQSFKTKVTQKRSSIVPKPKLQYFFTAQRISRRIYWNTDFDFTYMWYFSGRNIKDWY